MICTVCGKRLPDDANFCNICGAGEDKLAKEAPDTEPQPAETPSPAPSLDAFETQPVAEAAPGAGEPIEEAVSEPAAEPAQAQVQTQAPAQAPALGATATPVSTPGPIPTPVKAAPPAEPPKSRAPIIIGAVIAVIVLALVGVALTSGGSNGGGSGSGAVAEKKADIVQLAGSNFTGYLVLPETWERLHYENDAFVYYDGASNGDSVIEMQFMPNKLYTDGAKAWVDSMKANGIEATSEETQLGESKATYCTAKTDQGLMGVYFVEAGGSNHAVIALFTKGSSLDELNNLAATYATDNLDSYANSQWAGDDHFGYVKLPMEWNLLQKSNSSISVDYFLTDDLSQIYGDKVGNVDIIEMYDKNGRSMSGPVIAEISNSDQGANKVEREESLEMPDGTSAKVSVSRLSSGNVLVADYSYSNAGTSSNAFMARYIDEPGSSSGSASSSSSGSAASSSTSSSSAAANGNVTKYDEIALTHVEKKPTSGSIDSSEITKLADHVFGFLNMGPVYQNGDFGFQLVAKPGDKLADKQYVASMGQMNWKRGDGVSFEAILFGSDDAKQYLIVMRDGSGMFPNPGSADDVVNETMMVYDYAGTGYGGMSGSSAHSEPVTIDGREVPCIFTENSRMKNVTVEAFIANGSDTYIELIAIGGNQDEALDMLKRVKWM